MRIYSKGTWLAYLYGKFSISFRPTDETYYRMGILLHRPHESNVVYREHMVERRPTWQHDLQAGSAVEDSSRVANSHRCCSGSYAPLHHYPHIGNTGRPGLLDRDHVSPAGI
jgi:hypothetical protein